MLIKQNRTKLNKTKQANTPFECSIHKGYMQSSFSLIVNKPLVSHFEWMNEFVKDLNLLLLLHTHSLSLFSFPPLSFAFIKSRLWLTRTQYKLLRRIRDLNGRAEPRSDKTKGRGRWKSSLNNNYCCADLDLHFSSDQIPRVSTVSQLSEAQVECCFRYLKAQFVSM